MTSLASRRLRWLLPPGIAAAIALASLTTTAASASPQPKLAPRTAAELLAAVEQANPAGLSGTIVETAKLGLPSLPNIGSAGGDATLTPQALVAGSHTMRVWYSGQDRQRFALLGQLSESDVVRNSTDVWTYSSSTRAVTHSKLAPQSSQAAKTAVESKVPALTPQAAAEKALAAIDPTTTVRVDRTARVANHAAYQLLLIPKDTRSLIGSVRIAVESTTFVPLRVQIYAQGATSAAFQVGFIDVNFHVPSNSIFNFVPPAGSKVIESKTPLGALGASGRDTTRGSDSNSAAPHLDAPGTTNGGAQATIVLGKGWTAVVEFSGGTGAGGAQGAIDRAGGSAAQLLDKVTTPVSGGRLITTALMSVLLTNDGKVFAGPVSGADLQRVAVTGHGL